MKQAVRNRIVNSKGDTVYYIISGVIMSILLVIALYPMIFVLSASFSSGDAVSSGRVVLWPVELNLEGYKTVFRNGDILRAYWNTLLYTSVGTVINVAMAMITAYPLSRRDLKGRGFLMLVFTFTMFFSGGLIPSYILNRNLGLVNSRWIMILGMGIGYSNLIITRTYFQTSIPNELFESAYIDGATEWQTFLKIALPLSGAIIAVMALYAAVGTWGSWYTAFIYITDQKKWPLQLRLRQILILNQTQSLDYGMMSQEEIEMLQHQAFMVYTMKYAIIFIACAPMLVLYPFVQKYFVKGVMIGSLKG